MSGTILAGRGTQIVNLPRGAWEAELREAPDGIRKRLEFMSTEHHAVRNFVVRELPSHGRPLTVEDISRALGLSGERTAAIVSDLETNLFFLARPDGGGISWAYPVTVDETGHRLLFSTGERLDAA